LRFYPLADFLPKWAGFGSLRMSTPSVSPASIPQHEQHAIERPGGGAGPIDGCRGGAMRLALHVRTHIRWRGEVLGRQFGPPTRRACLDKRVKRACGRDGPVFRRRCYRHFVPNGLRGDGNRRREMLGQRRQQLARHRQQRRRHCSGRRRRLERTCHRRHGRGGLRMRAAGNG
jgi:hypothetical protein